MCIEWNYGPWQWTMICICQPYGISINFVIFCLCLEYLLFHIVRFFISSIQMLTTAYTFHPWHLSLSSLIPERCGSNVTRVLFKLIFRNDILSAFCGISACHCTPLAINQHKIFPVYVWYSHYLDQCSLIFMSVYGITTMRLHVAPW